jgi:phosphate-selective porin
LGAGLVLGISSVSNHAFAQQSLPPPDTDYAEPEPRTPPAIPATGFIMPDVPDNWSKDTSYDGRWFSTTFMTALLVDYNTFAQDDASLKQVGEQENQWDLRTWRLMTRGRMKFSHPVDYFISLEVKGQDHVQNDASEIGFTDFEISTGVGFFGTLHFGKIKEPFVYEMVGDAANLQQQERALSPFFASRGIGLRLNKSFAGDSMTYGIGWFNDWWTQDQQFRESGNNFSGRLTGVPYWQAGGANYVHVAIAARFVGDDAGKVQFRGRPESNVSTYYVDSGSLTADHANELGFEGLWGAGPLLIGGDVTRAWVAAADSGNPRFWGAYVVASYVLTGEHRPYDRKVGYTRRILPEARWGAWEIVGRYSHVDVADRQIDGGIFDRETVGLNWWATRRWKFGIDYGHIDLKRAGSIGTTGAVQTRIQWTY